MALFTPHFLGLPKADMVSCSRPRTKPLSPLQALPFAADWMR